jgi:hypothetical protein
MVIFHSYVKLPEGKNRGHDHDDGSTWNNLLLLYDKMDVQLLGSTHIPSK